MQIQIGTSGYGYKEWIGSFYPEGTKAKGMLAYYATKLATVEINYTFRRMPTATLLEGWAKQVAHAPSFTFVLKAPERITHRAKLKDARETTDAFVAASRTLGPRLGAFLFQLPPHAKKDVGTLTTFLQDLKDDARRAAFEFRHPSWHEEDALAVLRAHGAALCLSESDDTVAGDELGAPLVSTADWSYLRLRRTDYRDADLAAWSKRLRAQPWERAFVFLKHEDEGKGAAFAMKLREIFAG